MSKTFCLLFTNFDAAAFTPDMAMGWIDPWVWLGWVGLGRVRSNMMKFIRHMRQKYKDMQYRVYNT